jgi:hypothetical protein
MINPGNPAPTMGPGTAEISMVALLPVLPVAVTVYTAKREKSEGATIDDKNDVESRPEYPVEASKVPNAGGVRLESPKYEASVPVVPVRF